jgi:hypothetical protein
VPCRLDAPPVPRKPLLVAFEPQGSRRGNLRCRCRGALAIESDSPSFILWPRDIRGVRRNRLTHHQSRTEAALEPGRQTAHAQCDYVASGIGGVLQTRGQCACAQQHHPIRDPHRQDLGLRSSTEVRRAAGRPASQDAERAGPVPRVVKEEDLSVGIHGAVMKSVGLNNASAELAEEMLRQREPWR